MQISLRRILPLALAVLVLGAGAYRIAGPSGDADASALGGPVILGGDDLTDHGSVDGGGNAVDGWLYIQRAIENIGPNVTRPGNNGSIAALGSAAGSVVTAGDDAGAAIDLAGLKTSRSVTHYEGGAAIDAFFASLASSATNPAIIDLAGTGAGNDFDDVDGATPGDGLGGTGEKAAITAHAAEIASFVSSGGGLFSHGTFYDWLGALVPGATAVFSGSSDDLYFTPDGLTDLLSLSVANINAGPWHNHFEGNLGGLKVLVRSSGVLDNTGADAPVIIGGTKVTFGTPVPQATEDPSETPTRVRLKTHTPTRTPTPAATSTPTPSPPTNTPAATNTPAPSPSGGRGGVIVGPNTGSGPGGGGSSRFGYLLGAAMLLTLGGVATTTAARRSKRG